MKCMDKRIDKTLLEIDKMQHVLSPENTGDKGIINKSNVL